MSKPLRILKLFLFILQAAQGNGVLSNGVSNGHAEDHAGGGAAASSGGDAKGGGEGSGPLEALVSQVEAAVEHGVNADDEQVRRYRVSYGCTKSSTYILSMGCVFLAWRT